MRFAPFLAVIGQPCAPLLLEVSGPGERSGVTFVGELPTCDFPEFPAAAALDRATASCGPLDLAWSAGRGHDALQAAIDAAPDGGAVLVCPGDHVASALISGRTLEIASLSGDAADTTLRIGGVDVDGDGAADGLVVVGSTVTVSDLRVVGAQGPEHGAIASDGSALRLSHVIASDNAAESGAALHASGGYVEVVDSQFSDNAGGYDGGAIALHDVPCSRVADTTFDANHAGYEGGAIALAPNGSETTLVLERATFRGNSSGYSGGAVSVNGWSPALLYAFDATFDGNDAGYAGGGIGAGGWEPFEVVLVDSDFAVNTSGHDGGAVQIGGWADDLLRVDGGTFTANEAGASGGAIASGGWGHQANSIANATFAGNSAASGGAVSLASTDAANDAVFSGGLFESNTAGDAAIAASGRGDVSGSAVGFLGNEAADVATPCGDEVLSPEGSFSCDSR